jgi:hypothetical protein
MSGVKVISEGFVGLRTRLAKDVCQGECGVLTPNLVTYLQITGGKVLDVCFY